MHVLVTGSSKLTPAQDLWALNVLRERLSKLDTGNSVLFNGGAYGVDEVARIVAHAQKLFEIRTFPAQWSRFGKGAGMIRNGYMLSALRDAGGYSDEALALALLPTGKWTNGTLDMSKRVISSGIRLEVWVPKNTEVGQIYAQLPISVDAANAMTLTY